MYLTRSEYDRGVNTFSPQGRLFQVEYAIAAINLGSTAVGIQSSEGVVLAAEKRITSPLLLPSSVHKVMEIDSHLGCAMSGLTADARILVNHARVEAQHYRFTYDEPLPVESCTQGICDLALRFGEDLEDDEDAMSRPFGVSLLVAGVDAQHGPQLFHTDPSGTFLRYAAKAIGAGSEGAQTQLENEYHRSLTLHEAKVLSLQVLKQVMEEKLEAYNVEVGVISTVDRQFRILSTSEVVALLSELKPTEEEQSKA
jgi:20S proteasome subunit alpha 5